MKRAAATDPQPPTSEELRRAALARSAQRGARVASRRIALRWLGWFGWRATKWLSLPALAAVSIAWWWQAGGHLESSVPSPSALPASAARVPASAAPVPPATASDIALVEEPASAPGISRDAGAVRLRLDSVDAEDLRMKAPLPQAQSASSPDNTGRERER